MPGCTGFWNRMKNSPKKPGLISEPFFAIHEIDVIAYTGSPSSFFLPVSLRFSRTDQSPCCLTLITSWSAVGTNSVTL